MFHVCPENLIGPFQTGTHQTAVFTRISVAALIKFLAPQVRRLRGWRLFEGSAYLKIGRYKEIFSFYLTVHLDRYEKITVSNRSVFSLSPFTSFRTSQWCLHSCNSDLTLPVLQQPFLEEKEFTVRF